MGQTIYYNRIAAEEKGGARRRSSVFSNDPSQPLIAARDRRRSSVASRRSSSRRGSLEAAILTEDENSYPAVARNALSILGVVAAGALGWGFAWWSGAWKVQDGGNSAGGEDNMPVGAEILGYISAVLYLTARIPQIIRNYQKKSCEGQSSYGRSVA